MMEERPLLVVRDLWVAYGSSMALEGVNLSVHKNEMMSVVGPNGGGKTTLLRAILGLLEPDQGEVRVMDLDPRHVSLKGRIGYLPQRSESDLRFPLRAVDVVAQSRYARKRLWEKLRPKDRSGIDEALESVGMGDKKFDHFGSLSGGQRQRVLIARALALDPVILILDEPSTGLDAVAQDAFYELLVRLKRERNLAVIMATHDIGSVSVFSDRVACLNRVIHFHGRPAECMNADALAAVFGKNVQFLIHDRECGTCQKGK